VDAKSGTREVACGHTEPEQPQDFDLRGQRKRKIRIPETLPWAHQLATCAELPNPLINHPWQAWCWFCVASFYSSTLMLPSRTSFRAVM
jgi:hypothetical protein